MPVVPQQTTLTRPVTGLLFTFTKDDKFSAITGRRKALRQDTRPKVLASTEMDNVGRQILSVATPVSAVLETPLPFVLHILASPSGHKLTMVACKVLTIQVTMLITTSCRRRLRLQNKGYEGISSSPRAVTSCATNSLSSQTFCPLLATDVRPSKICDHTSQHLLEPAKEGKRPIRPVLRPYDEPAGPPRLSFLDAAASDQRRSLLHKTSTFDKVRPATRPSSKSVSISPISSVHKTCVKLVVPPTRRILRLAKGPFVKFATALPFIRTWQFLHIPAFLILALFYHYFPL